MLSRNDGCILAPLLETRERVISHVTISQKPTPFRLKELQVTEKQMEQRSRRQWMERLAWLWPIFGDVFEGLRT